MNTLQRHFQLLSCQMRQRSLFNSVAVAKSLFYVTPKRHIAYTVDPSSERINKLNTGLFMNPHPAKAHKGGEDAAAITDNILSLADGVGGWAESGIDPAKFSRELCTNIDNLIAGDVDGRLYVTNPKQLLIDAVERTRETGSATCVIVSLDRDEPQLYTANLGDSGYLLLRKNGLDLISVFRSTEQ